MVSQGKVVEEGTHDQLMDLKGEYYHLVTAQVSSDDSVTDSTAGLYTLKMVVYFFV